VKLRKPDSTGLQPNQSLPLHFPPPGFAIQPLKAGKASDRSTYCDRGDVADLANDLKRHARRYRGRLPEEVHSRADRVVVGLSGRRRRTLGITCKAHIDEVGGVVRQLQLGALSGASLRWAAPPLL
jgi:hypothetical protein